MLLLVTLVLVVASAILLVLGFVRDALGYIYLSMVCAGVAAVALILFARLARRRSMALVGAGALGGSAQPRGSQAEPPWSGPESPVQVVDDRVEPAEAEESEPVGDPWFPEAQVAGLDEVDDRSEVMAPSPALYPERSVAYEDEAPVAEPEPVPAPPTEAAVSSDDEGEWDETGQWADWGEEVVFPIEDYDDLRVAEILPLLPQLERDELQDVRDRELAGKARATIVDRIDELTGAKPERRTGSGPARPTSPATERRAAPAPRRRATPAPEATEAPPAKKAAARKSAAAPAAATKKAPAKKAATAKQAAPAKRVAKKAGAEPAPAPATKRAVKKAAAEPAAPAKKTAAKRVAAARSGTAAAKKAPAKRAGGVKKTE